MNATTIKFLSAANAEDYCIKVDDEEIQSDHDFQCSDCGEYNEAALPSNKDACTYGRHCTGCGKRYGVRAWTELRSLQRLRFSTSHSKGPAMPPKTVKRIKRAVTKQEAYVAAWNRRKGQKAATAKETPNRIARDLRGALNADQTEPFPRLFDSKRDQPLPDICLQIYADRTRGRSGVSVESKQLLCMIMELRHYRAHAGIQA